MRNSVIMEAVPLTNRFVVAIEISHENHAIATENHCVISNLICDLWGGGPLKEDFMCSKQLGWKISFGDTIAAS